MQDEQIPAVGFTYAFSSAWIFKILTCFVVLQIKTVKLISPQAQFDVIQDDLLHPVLGGNKLRKLDAIIPKLISEGVTDIVSRRKRYSHISLPTMH